MKKIQFKSLSWTEAGLLRASLRRQLIAQHPDIKDMGGQVLISEAWKLNEERTEKEAVTPRFVIIPCFAVIPCFVVILSTFVPLSVNSAKDLPCHRCIRRNAKISSNNISTNVSM